MVYERVYLGTDVEDEGLGGRTPWGGARSRHGDDGGDTRGCFKLEVVE